MVAVLGGISTILASYLAKVRGSGEPEISSIRTRELNSFLREVRAFIIDDGSSIFFQSFRRGFVFLSLSELPCAYPGDKFGTEYDEKITMYRERFENIIKTEGEDSGPPGSGGHSWLPPPFYHAPQAPLPTHVMPGHHDVLPVQPELGVHVNGKQQTWKGRGAAGGVF